MRWILSWQGILMAVGVVFLVFAVAQHYISVLDIPHLAIYLGVVGGFFLILGIVLSITVPSTRRTDQDIW
jgi:hypothetical protein